MKLSAKVLILGMVLCVLGAILLDLGISATAISFITLGVLTLIVGPLAAENINNDPK